MEAEAAVEMELKEEADGDTEAGGDDAEEEVGAVSYTHLTLPTTPYV